MTNFRFSKRSLENLKGVHPYLVGVVVNALKCNTTVDFTVIEGLRTRERQQELFKKGTTKTLNSKHCNQQTGFGHAVDLLPYLSGVSSEEIWNKKEAFKAVSDAMFKSAKDLGIKIRWGGDWNQNGRSDDETFYDGPHFELIS